MSDNRLSDGRENDAMLIQNINEQYHLYPIFLVLSLVVGLVIPSIRLAKSGMKKDILLCVALLNMFLALIFGKAYTMIAEKSTDIIQSGFSSLGGLIGFLFGTYIFYLICDKNKEILKNYVISLPLIYAISKIGCFFAGCCHGIKYSGILSVRYETGSACQLSTSVFPVQMAETIVFLGIYFLLVYLKNKKENDGVVIGTLFLSGLAKFGLDFLRYSHVGKVLTSNQIVCLIIIITCVICGVKKIKWGKNYGSEN